MFWSSPEAVDTGALAPRQIEALVSRLAPSLRTVAEEALGALGGVLGWLAHERVLTEDLLVQVSFEVCEAHDRIWRVFASVPGFLGRAHHPEILELRRDARLQLRQRLLVADEGQAEVASAVDAADWSFLACAALADSPRAQGAGASSSPGCSPSSPPPFPVDEAVGLVHARVLLMAILDEASDDGAGGRMAHAAFLRASSSVDRLRRAGVQLPGLSSESASVRGARLLRNATAIHSIDPSGATSATPSAAALEGWRARREPHDPSDGER